MERLSADDTRILRLESDAIAGHTLKLAIVEPALDGQPLTVERVRNRVEARLGSLPRARQRLAPTPLRLAPPAWVDDPEFDVRKHVRAAPGAVRDRAQLMRLVGSLMAERLDHARPLWCVDVAGPLEDGRTALVIRVHHCLADGVTFLRMLSELLWDTDDGSEAAGVRRMEPEPAPGRSRLLAAGARSRCAGIGSALAGGARRPPRLAVARCRSRAGRAPRHPAARALAAGSRYGVRSPHQRRARGGVHRLRAGRPEANRARRGKRRDGQRRRPGRGRRSDPALAGRSPRADAGDARPDPGQHAPPGRGPDELGNRDSFLFCDLPVAEPDPGSDWRRSTPRP